MIRREDMELLASAGRPIRVGIVGVGAMGAGVLHTLHAMAGIRCVALADLNVERAIEALSYNAVDRDAVVVSDDRPRCLDAIRKGKVAVTTDPKLLVELELDVVVEATGVSGVGACVAYDAIHAGKHVVMLTVEADVVVGPILTRMAKSAGVVYTLAAGDQPGSILELFHWSRSLGFDVIAAGRGTIRYPNDRHDPPPATTPHKVSDNSHTAATGSRPHVGLVSASPKMANSFKDGSKAQVEMAAVANATGLLPDRRGMHEPCVGSGSLAKQFALKEKGGLLSRTGVIEMANAVNDRGEFVAEGHVHPGVFLVVDSEHPGVKKFMNQFFRWWEGPAGTLFRPYHLTCLETPMSIARAAMLKVSTGSSTRQRTEVVCAAKRDLAAGEVMDGPGGEHLYGLVELREVACAENLVPFGLAEGAPLVRPVRRDQFLTWDDVRVDTGSFLYKLRQLQDSTGL